MILEESKFGISWDKKFTERKDVEIWNMTTKKSVVVLSGGMLLTFKLAPRNAQLMQKMNYHQPTKI